MKDSGNEVIYGKQDAKVLSYFLSGRDVKQLILLQGCINRIHSHTYRIDALLLESNLIKQ